MESRVCGHARLLKTAAASESGPAGFRLPLSGAYSVPEPYVRDGPLEHPMHAVLLCVFSQERSWYHPVHYVPGFAFGRHAAVLHQHHDEVFKLVATSLPWPGVSLLYYRTDIESERVDVVATLRPGHVGVILVFLRSVPHKSGSNVRDTNGVGDSQAR